MRRVLGVCVLAALAVAGFATGSFATSGAAEPQASEATSRVTVVATEFKFRLSRKSVPTGLVIFKVVNRGKVPHDFKIAGKKTRVLKPGTSAILRVRFKKKRRFAYICTIPGHAAIGMKGVLPVGTTPGKTTRS